MAKNILVINIDIRETRVALIENGIIAELHIERQTARGTLGNIVLGKVSRVLPGMQAAFIDIGQERAAFLHVEDLIRPDDFEAYLSGHRHGRASGSGGSQARAGAADEPEISEEDVGDPDVDVIAEAHADATAEVEAEAEGEPQQAAADEAEADEADAAEAEADEADADEADDAGVAADAAEAEEDAGEAEPEAAEAADADEDEADAEDQETELAGAPGPSGEADAADDLAPNAEVSSETGEPEDGAAGEAPADENDAGASARRARSRRGGRGRRRRGRTADSAVKAPVVAEPPAAPKAKAPAPRAARADRGRKGSDSREGRGRRSGGREKDPLRVSKSTPIRDVVREGQEVIVQVSKEPIGTKGARVTSHISLPGRYVVYLPTVEHVGISKRIGSDKERGRLREAIEAMKPPQGGLIVRTLAEGLTKKSLKADVGYLVRLWGEIAKKREQSAKAPALLYAELDLVLKTARDLFTDDVEKIVIDSKEEHARLRRFVEMFMPERVDAIELYEGDEPIFDEYGIEDEIGRALSRKVPLASGGHLIIDQAEALTAIDVNTGRYVGKGSKDLEETILQTNLEAVEEIAYQLRFRNIGGLIILDLIDMERAGNREKVRRRLEQLLEKDKAKTTLNRISDLGLIEMTRKRTRESLGRIMNEPCFYCDGTGNLQSRQTIAYEILREIKREVRSLRGYSVVVNAHPAVVDCLRNEERSAVQEAERRYTRRIELVPRKEYHLEQFDLVGK